MDKDKLTEIAQDKEFIQKLLNQRTDEDFKSTLEEKDINVSLDDAKKIRTKLTAALNGEVNLTDEELEAIGGGTSLGDAIKYVFNISVVLALLLGAGKVGCDVYDDVSNRKTAGGMFDSTTCAAGLGSKYKRDIHKIGNAIIDISGGKNKDNEHHKDMKSLTGSQKESAKTVKGFGIKNGKLF
ncbi:MAG: hypothetical protein LBR79_01725 [Oscillospiraceae bacterium]|jgi:hypothetical protein|nr:hypothetical protein [Oscillospiraceae bacterium]